MTALDRAAILAGMSTESSDSLSCLTVMERTDSTNSAILRLPDDQQHAHAVVAEQQTGGRGRRQRSWHSPPGGNIYLSLGWRFGKQAPASLPLVVAVSLCRALDQLGLRGHGIKWPNDVQVGELKLAGILVEMQSSGSGPLLAVIGVGLNVDMSDADTASIGRPWTDLKQQMGQAMPDRNRITAAMIVNLVAALQEFSESGLAPFHSDWSLRDVLAGQAVTVEQEGALLRGRANGIAEDGALRLIAASGEAVVIHSGEVSVRYG